MENLIPKTPPFTIALVVISVVVFGLMAIGQQQPIIGALLISKSPYIKPVLPEVFQGEIWRLFSPMFLHFGIFHIVFNMLLTWELGRLVEWRQGAMILAILTAITSLASNLSQYLVIGPNFGGMSGVIYGFFGYTWIQSLTNPKFGIQINPVIVKLLLGWFLICWSGVLEKFFGLGIANTAHTAGLASGILMSLVVSGISKVANRY